MSCACDNVGKANIAAMHDMSVSFFILFLKGPAREIRQSESQWYYDTMAIELRSGDLPGQNQRKPLEGTSDRGGEFFDSGRKW